MRLSKIRFKNVKGFREDKTAPDGYQEMIFDERMNILIGRNGSGKSTILEIIAFLSYGYDDHLTQYCHDNLHFPPYGPDTKVEVTLIDTDSIVVEYSAEEYGHPIKARSKIDVVDSDKGCEVMYRLKIDRILLNSTQCLTNISIKNFLLSSRFREQDAVNDCVPSSIEHILPSLCEFHTNCHSLYCDASNLQEFVNDRYRSIFHYVDDKWRINLAYTKDKVMEFLRDHFDIDVIYERMPNDGTVNRTNIRNRCSGMIYLATQEAHGIVWLLQVALRAIDCAPHFILIDEPESYLHPEYQARLINALATIDVQLIIATHSSVFIDQTFDLNVSLFHFITRGCNRYISPVSRSGSLFPVLQDLGIKPSQILQTNGVVWVEGDTDRLYLKKWIRIYCEQNCKPEPIEGIHYSMLEYGGKCLSHLTLASAEISYLKTRDLSMLIPVMCNNHNNFIVMDSDKKHECDEINETKRRIANECAGRVWITSGKEIENYVPQEALGFPLNKFESIEHIYGENYPAIDRQTGKSKPATLNKSKFARSIIDKISSDNWLHLPDLEENIENLVSTINQWNSYD